MTKWIAAAAVLSLALTGCRGRGMDPERVEKQLSYQVEDLLDDVDATPAQRTRTEELKKQLVTDLVPLMKQSSSARTEIVEQWKKPIPETAKVHGVIDAQFDAMRALTHKLADAAIEFHQLLSPEQRQTLTKRLDRRQQ
jgi:protein CpxP